MRIVIAQPWDLIDFQQVRPIIADEIHPKEHTTSVFKLWGDQGHHVFHGLTDLRKHDVIERPLLHRF